MEISNKFSENDPPEGHDNDNKISAAADSSESNKLSNGKVV